MTDHPITPPPELLEQLRKEAPSYSYSYCSKTAISREQWIATKLAQWGYNQAIKELHAFLEKVNTSNDTEALRLAQKIADQELDACCAWLDGYKSDGWDAGRMRDDRRPKPPSLKEQAMKDNMTDHPLNEDFADPNRWSDELRKPPLGIMPERLWKQERLFNLIHAINRYLLASKDVPGKWFIEMQSLIDDVYL